MAETMTDFAAEREAMIDRQLKRRGITNTAILDAFLAVPREAFVSPQYAHRAYGDHPLPIQAAGIEQGDKVLEVGAGSGYAAAVISRIAGTVVAVERQHELVELARSRLERLGYGNVEVVEGDGTKGWPDAAPFDAILAAASGSHVPDPLIEQLAPGGSIVMPLGSPGWAQQLIKVTKRPDGSLEHQDLGAVQFVPLIGEEGWKDGRN
jgi:protein-L-isoaspartate(D-aspartate) O-methyltransferase